MFNTFKTTALLAVLMALFIFIGGAVGGRGGMMIAFVMGAIFNFGAYWYSDKIVLKMYRAQPVTRDQAPEIFDIVERLVAKANIPMPKVYIIGTPSPNAFATGRNPEHAAVAVTAGILKILNREELEGVLAHELAHVKNRDTLISAVSATLAGAIMMLARIAQFGAIFGGMGGRDSRDNNIFGMLAMAILAPLVAMMIQMAISRSREYLADATGAEFAGNPYGLANALRKLADASQRIPMVGANPATTHMMIVQPAIGVRSFANLFSTHPPTEKRIEKLLSR